MISCTQLANLDAPKKKISGCCNQFCSHIGAKLLMKGEGFEIWSRFMDVILDRIESYQAKENAMKTLTNLLKLVSI